MLVQAAELRARGRQDNSVPAALLPLAWELVRLNFVEGRFWIHRHCQANFPEASVATPSELCVHKTMKHATNRDTLETERDMARRVATVPNVVLVKQEVYVEGLAGVVMWPLGVEVATCIGWVAIGTPIIAAMVAGHRSVCTPWLAQTNTPQLLRKERTTWLQQHGWLTTRAASAGGGAGLDTPQRLQLVFRELVGLSMMARSWRRSLTGYETS